MKLWNRERVDALKKTALVRDALVMLERNAGPADGAQAARELLPGAEFSHLKWGQPVYTVGWRAPFGRCQNCYEQRATVRALVRLREGCDDTVEAEYCTECAARKTLEGE